MTPPLDKAEDSAGDGGEEAEIYVRTLDERGDGYYWLKINRYKSPTNKFMKSYLPHVEGWGYSSIAALGYTIYSVGGTTKPKSAPRVTLWDKPNACLHFLDTSSPSPQWKRGASMKRPRAEPYIVPLPDGKLIVLGGCSRPPEIQRYPEIYNLESGIWTTQNSIPVDDVDQPSFYGHMVFGNKILLYPCGGGSLYSYDVKEDYWQLYSTRFSKYVGLSALIDGIMYLVSDQYLEHGDPFLFAYNFEKFDPNYNKEKTDHPLSPKMPVEWLPKDDHVKDDVITTEWLPDPKKHFYRVTLLAVGGGNLAIIWGRRIRDHVGEDGFKQPQVEIYVSIFKMRKTRNPKDGSLHLAASPVSHKRYLGQGAMFIDCVAVSRKVQAHQDLDYGSNPGQMKQLKNKRRNRKRTSTARGFHRLKYLDPRGLRGYFDNSHKSMAIQV